jgi:hypothetical protein
MKVWVSSCGIDLPRFTSAYRCPLRGGVTEGGGQGAGIRVAPSSVNAAGERPRAFRREIDFL